MSHQKYLLRRPNPYRPEEMWYYSSGAIPWTNRPERAALMTLEKAEEVGLEILEEINVACEIIGPY